MLSVDAAAATSGGADGVPEKVSPVQLERVHVQATGVRAFLIALEEFHPQHTQEKCAELAAKLAAEKKVEADKAAAAKKAAEAEKAAADKAAAAKAAASAKAPSNMCTTGSESASAW